MLLPVQPCKVGIPFLGVLKNIVFHSSVHMDKLIAPLPFRLTGIPANPKRDHHWVKRKSTKSLFCQHIFNSMPRFFAHHQIDLAQRDGKKMLMSMITAVSRILCLDFDFPENYTHINQVRFASYALLVRLCFPTQLQGWSSLSPLCSFPPPPLVP